jgi:hypothetical protein
MRPEDRDMSRMSDETLVRDLIISHTIGHDDLGFDYLGYDKAIIRELMSRGWAANEITKAANDAPWVDRALRMAEDALECGAEFKPVRFDALTCTPTCAKRLQRGHALAYLSDLSKKQQKLERALHDADDASIAARKNLTTIVRKNRAARRAQREDKRRQQSEQHAEQAKQHAVDTVLANAMRAQIAKENDAERVKLRGTVAAVVKLFLKEQRNDISAAAVFAWVDGAAPGRYTVEEVETAIASLDVYGNLAPIRDEAQVP